MSLDRVSGVVEDRSGPQVVLAHPEGLLDVPQLVVGGDDLTSVHQACRNVGDVALEADQGTGSGDGGLIQGGVTGVDGDKTVTKRVPLGRFSPAMTARARLA